MNKRKIYYLLHSGKNCNLAYYARSYLREWMPRAWTQRQLDRLLREVEQRPDRDDILRRVDYYCRLTADSPIDREQWQREAVALRDQPMTKPSPYYHDAMEVARYFDDSLRWILLPGDITYTPSLPTIVKSRPLTDNDNAVVLKLDKNRHFIFVDDNRPWSEKRDMAIFRGDLGPLKEIRDVFMLRFAGNQSPLVDAAATNIVSDHPEWQGSKLTIDEHLDYKFILSLEGNDVASNLKWVMSSGSIAVCPRHTCETWFMEGTLIPNYHYIEVKDDFSDLEERLRYYMAHPDEAQTIIQHAHDYVAQFRDPARERLISLLVLKRYFEITNGHYKP